MKKVTPAPVVKKAAPRGVYVYKPITSTIVECACGNKYISTRLKQTTCVRCMPRT